MSTPLRNVISLAILASFSTMAIGSGEDDAEVEAEVSAEDAIKVKSTELEKAYDENEVAADEKYKGKSLLVSGTVESINKGIGDDMYVTLGEGSFVIGCDAYFADDHKDDLKSLKKGQKVTVLCQGDGKLMGPQLRGCSLQSGGGGGEKASGTATASE